MNNNDMELRYKLTDHNPDDSNQTEIQVKVECKNGHIYISPSGYGDCDSKDGDGTPIMLEFYNGELRLIAWTDINESVPTILNFDNAKEENRKI